MNFLHNRKERLEVAERLRARQRSIEQHKRNLEISASERNADQQWKQACDIADGTIRISWQHLPLVSERVYNYNKDFGIHLVHLAFEGNALQSLQEIPQRCQTLRHLSLPSNAICDINGIHHLAKLESLNLLRNELTSLPTGIGDLVNLTRLELANNRLSHIPDSIGKLTNLSQLNLESNQLAALPRDFGQLKCEVLNLNYNSFVCLPDCILSLTRLRRLSLIGNELTSLPIGLQRFDVLEVLHASRNKISILPDSIVDMSTLRELWLDTNQLSSLPEKFHRLTKLQVLRLEGNVDMIYPSPDIVAKGAIEVLRWSRNRISRKRLGKVRNIVQSLGNILQQIQRYKVGGELHESIFRVVDDQVYQFPPDAFWSILLPKLQQIWSNPDVFSGGINSFSFERREVEQAIFQFRDAAGSIVKKVPSAKFQKCSCSQQCIPSKDGFMCTRPALLLRMNMVYEENMVEKRRLEAFEKKVADAAKEAETIATNFLKTEDGMMMVRDEAEKRIASGREETTQSLRSLSQSRLSSTMSTIASKLRGNRESFKSLRKRHEAEVRKEYIDQEIEKRSTKVKEENDAVRRIMKKWVGNSISDTFRGWRDVVQGSKKQRRGKARAKLRAERRSYENNVALFELRTLELTKYEEMYDQFSDLPVWVHRDTNETLYDKPTNTLTYPKRPNSLLDKDGKPLTPRTIAWLEASSSSSEDSSSSSQISEEDSQSYASGALNDKPITTRDHQLKGKEAELEYSKKRVLEKRNRRIVEVAARAKSTVPRDDNDNEI